MTEKTVKLDAETIRAVAAWGDEHGDEYYRGYDGVSDKLRALAKRVDSTGELGGYMRHDEY